MKMSPGKWQFSSAVASLAITIGLSACAPPAENEVQRGKRIELLAGEIQSLRPNLSPPSTRRFAAVSVETAARKRLDWNIHATPWVNNFFVNAKINEYGLCYQWADYLYYRLNRELPAKLRMKLICRNRGKLNEHNAVCLYSQGGDWHKGLVLDGWKEAGILLFYPVSADAGEWMPR